MKKLSAICFLFLFVCASQALAAVPTDAQVDRMVQLLGVKEQLEAQKDVINKQARENAEQSKKMIKSSFPNMSRELEKAIQEESDHYLAKLNDAYDTEAMTRFYVQLISKKLSSEDVDQIIAFCETPAGKNLTRASVEVTGPWVEQIMGDYNQKFAAYTQEYVDKLTQKMMSSVQQQETPQGK